MNFFKIVLYYNCMRTVSNIELNYIASLKEVIPEVINVRHNTPINEQLETYYDEREPFFENTYVGKLDKELREIHKTSYEWANEGEDPELIKEVITSYCSSKINQHDVITVIDMGINY